MIAAFDWKVVPASGIVVVGGGGRRVPLMHVREGMGFTTVRASNAVKRVLKS